MANTRGIRFGCKKMPLPEGFHETSMRLRNKEITIDEVLTVLKVNRKYFYRLKQETIY